MNICRDFVSTVRQLFNLTKSIEKQTFNDSQQDRSLNLIVELITYLVWHNTRVQVSTFRYENR